jgi:hypothetical protein
MITFRTLVFACSVVLAGCGARVAATDTTDAGTPSAAEGGVDDPPLSIDCLADDLPAPPRKLMRLYYLSSDTVGDVEGPQEVGFEASSCVMGLNLADGSPRATLSPTDCDHFIRWLSSDLLVTHLRDDVTCVGNDRPMEQTALVFSDLDPVVKNTASCPEEPFVSHRACIAKLRAKYFPGK